MMRKIMVLLAVITVVLCLSFAVCADTVTIGNIEYNYSVTEDGSAHINSMLSYAYGEVVIPEKIGEYTVTYIDDFRGLKNADSIVMPDTVTQIGTFAFGYMYNLIKVKLSQSLESISYCAFTNCKELKSINIPASVTAIEDAAFNYCELLTHVSLSENIKSIGKSAFYACKSIKSINFPNGLTEIGPNAFFLCKNLENVLIPKSVISIGECAFAESSRDDMGTFPQYHISRTYKNICYTGTKEEWAKISIGDYNTNLTNSNITFNAPALFVKFEKTDCATVFTVTAENLEGAVIALSGYKDNTLCYFAPGIVTTNITATFVIPNITACDKIKVFAFDSIANFKPLCENTERVFNI